MTHCQLTESSHTTHGALTESLTEDSHREGKGREIGREIGREVRGGDKHHGVTYVTREPRDAMMACGRLVVV